MILEFSSLYSIKTCELILYLNTKKHQLDFKKRDCVIQAIQAQLPISFVPGIHMKGTVVEVCRQNCTQCGDAAGETGASEWALFNCSTPITGNKISISKNEVVIFCEIEIITA